MIDYIIGSNCGRSARLRPVVAGCTFVSHFATRRMLPRATSWSSSNRDRTRWRGLWMTGLKKLSFQIREDLLSISAWANWQAIFLSHLDKRHLSKSNVANPWTFLIPQFHWNILEAPWPIIRSWTIMAQGNESARRAISGTARVFNAGHRDAETQTAWDDKKPDPLAA